MSAHRKLIFNAGAVIALCLSMTGCGGLLPKKEPLQLFTPQVHVDPDPAWPKVDWQLTVARPNSSNLLDSRRMLVSPAPGQIQVYEGAAWNDDVPDIVQDTIVHAFEDSGKIIAAGRQTTGLHAEFSLQLELREDQAVYRTPAGPPEISITITARLIDFASNRATASRTFHQAVAANGITVPDVTRAFDSALGAIAHDIVGWTLASGQQARAAAKAKP
jgi:cholesterol transport system auxiliary component